MVRREPLGLFAVRRALGRGWTDYGHAGCTQTLSAWGNGWLRRDRRYRPARFFVTPEGEQALADFEEERP